MEILGKDIREAFKVSMDTDFCMQDGKGSGFRGKYLERLHISGGYIEYKGKDIINIIINDKPLEDNRWYSVDTSDYLQRGTGYVSISNKCKFNYNLFF